MERTYQNRGLDGVEEIRDRAKAIVEAWALTYSLGVIAEVLDVSKSAVHRWTHGDRPVRRLAAEIIRREGTFGTRLEQNSEVA